jgi:hypothetical protein
VVRRKYDISGAKEATSGSVNLKEIYGTKPFCNLQFYSYTSKISLTKETITVLPSHMLVENVSIKIIYGVEACVVKE